MYYLVEAYGKTGLLAGARTTIGLEAAKMLRDALRANPDFGEVSIFSTEVCGGLIDKKEKLYV